jgi:protein disulfide-isomerase
MMLWLVFVAAPVLGVEAGWHRDWTTAAEEARRSARPILVVFTGSDWCPHCRLLEENVLKTGAFHSWAADRFVFLEIDLPRQGIPQAVRDERSAVCRQFGVSSFPQVVLASADGRRLAGVKGYSKQPAEAWIADFDRRIEPDFPAGLGEGTPSRLAGAISPGPRPDPVGAPPPSAASDPLAEAVERSGRSRRPVLVVVSRASDEAGRQRAASLALDPEFRGFADAHFEVAAVESPPASVSPPPSETAEDRIGSLLGGVPLPPHEVELIVTYDGHTPLYSQSGRQAPARIVSRLKWFLAAMSGLPSRSLIR